MIVSVVLQIAKSAWMVRANLPAILEKFVKTASAVLTLGVVVPGIQNAAAATATWELIRVLSAYWMMNVSDANSARVHSTILAPVSASFLVQKTHTVATIFAIQIASTRADRANGHPHQY
jgi:hypothetical protein